MKRIKKNSEFNGYEGGMKIKWIANKYYIIFRTHHSHLVYISREKKMVSFESQWINCPFKFNKKNVTFSPDFLFLQFFFRFKQKNDR